jgi:hypothetical protein
MKVTYVEGDMAKAGLGLSTEHHGLLMSSHISLPFQIVASVSFKDTILGTIQTNAWPAIEVVRLSSNAGRQGKETREHLCTQ